MEETFRFFYLNLFVLTEFLYFREVDDNIVSLFIFNTVHKRVCDIFHNSLPKGNQDIIERNTINIDI